MRDTLLIGHGNARRASRAAGPEPGEARRSVAAAPRCCAAAVPGTSSNLDVHCSDARERPFLLAD